MVRFFQTVGSTSLIVAGLMAVAARPVSAAEGLIAHWKFDAVSADGKTVKDHSGAERHGRLTGPATLVDGKLGKALKLPGPPVQMNIGDLALRGPATVAFWFNTRELFADRRILSQLTGPGDAAGALRFDGGQLEVYDGRNWQLLVKEGLRFDTWHHLAVVFDGEDHAVGYLDGKLKQAAKSGFHFAGAQAAIAGKQLAKNGNPFIGRIDDFRVYNRSLSAVEVRKLLSAHDPSKHGR